MLRLQRYSNLFWTISHPRRAVSPDGDGAAVSAARHHLLTSDAPADEIALNDLNRSDLLATGGVASSAVRGADAASEQKRGKKSKQKQSSAMGRPALRARLPTTACSTRIRRSTRRRAGSSTASSTCVCHSKWIASQLLALFRTSSDFYMKHNTCFFTRTVLSLYGFLGFGYLTLINHHKGQFYDRLFF